MKKIKITRIKAEAKFYQPLKLNNMNSLFDTLAQIINPAHQKVMPLAAIWLTAKVKIEGRETLRICPGDKVLIEAGELANVKESPSHEITNCYGTATGDFSITVICLKTLELSEIKL